MKKDSFTPHTIVEIYIKVGLKRSETILSGDYKRGNKAHRKIIKTFKFLEENLDVARSVLPLLFRNENTDTRTLAAAHCLALNVFVKEAEEVLETVASDAAGGIFAFNARMTLKAWREQGYLKVYS